MSRPLRLEYPGSIWHITSRGNARRTTFRDDTDRRRFLRLLETAIDRFRWTLYAYVLMSNHIHLVLELSQPTLSRGMQWLNSKYAQLFNRRHQRSGHLFQGRFGGFLIDKASYLHEVLRYVVLNPVRANMTARPEQYAWSSYRATVGDDPSPPWLAVDHALEGFGSEPRIARAEYRQYVAAGIGATHRPWDGLVGQIYLGGPDWIYEVREQIDAKPRSDEIPEPQKNFIALTMSRIVTSVAEALVVDEDRIRFGRGGKERMLAAWLGCHEGLLDLRAIAAGLRLRSMGHVSNLIDRCDGELARNASLRATADQCADRIRLRAVEREGGEKGKKSTPQS